MHAQTFNLVVDLDEPPASSSHIVTELACVFPGVEIAGPDRAGERTLAWIDDAFGGCWSSEALAGANVVARRNGAPVGFATIDARGLRFAWLRGLARERDVGLFGPIGVAPELRGSPLGRTLLKVALGALRDRGFSRALIAAVGDERLVRYYADNAGARVAERFSPPDLVGRSPVRTLVMASGNGTNLQAVLDGASAGTLPLDVVGLVSNNAQAFAIERARRAGVPSLHVLPWDRASETRPQYDARLLAAVRACEPELVLLLGWMHLLDPRFVAAFPNLLNVHPAFLPLDPRRDEVVLPDGSQQRAFRGPRAVRDALQSGARWTGATVHAVTADTDRGPVLVRKPLHIAPEEAESVVMERLHPVEHQLVRSGVMRWVYERER